MIQRIPISKSGYERLRGELVRLERKDRFEVIRAIEVARGHGDLKENAEYHAAKEQQSFIEGRIAELDAKLASADIIDVKTVNANGKVVFGATVDLINIETDEKVTYQIVGDDEADIKQSRISVSSPIARALIGKEEGDVATVNAPGGVKEYEVIAVKYI